MFPKTTAMDAMLQADIQFGIWKSERLSVRIAETRGGYIRKTAYLSNR
jgi:hypothetical protein